MNESTFQTKVMKHLNSNNYVFAMKVRGGGSVRGIPDIVGVANGVFFAWELKRSLPETRKKSGRIRLQLHILGKIRAAGGVGELVCPENWEAKIQQLELASGLTLS